MEKVLDLKARYPEFIRAGLGLHPAEAMHLSLEQIAAAYRFMENHLDEADMVGEIGLDYKYAETTEQKEFQARVLQDQLRLAERFRKGVNLHSRRALRETMEAAAAFAKSTGLPALLHWFTHSSKLIRQAAGHGIFVSAGPAVLYSKQTLETARAIPLDNLVLETDTPVPFGGVSARPHQVADVARALSEAQGVPLNDLARNTYANSLRLLGSET